MSPRRAQVRATARRWTASRRGESLPGQPPRTAITRLFRNPPQLRLLTGLLGEDGHSAQIRIYGVADGAEAVSLLVSIDPPDDADLSIEGFDISAEYLRAAQDLVFTDAHFAAGVDPAAYGDHLERVADGWQVRGRWRRFLHFAHGDVLAAGDRPPVDVVLCQNTLVGFDPGDVDRALSGLVAEVAPGGLLVVGGGRLDVVPPLALAQGLSPELEDVEAIHEAWEVQRRFWDNERRPWWALEPFDPGHRDGPARYCTVFRKAADG